MRTMIKLPRLPRRRFPWLKALDLKHEGTSDWRIRKLFTPQDLQRLAHFLQEPPRGHTAELYNSSALLPEEWNITKRSIETYDPDVPSRRHMHPDYRPGTRGWFAAQRQLEEPVF